jgi:hypothetical protein
VSGGRNHGVAEAIAACDEIEAALGHIRELLRNADTYRKRAFYESIQSLYEDIMLASERAWLGFAAILEDLPE